MVVLDQKKMTHIQKSLTLKGGHYKQEDVKIQRCRMQCMQWWCGVCCFGAGSSFQDGPTLLLLFDFSFDFSNIIMVFPMSHLHDGKCLETEKIKNQIRPTIVLKITADLKTWKFLPIFLCSSDFCCAKYPRLCQYFINTNLFESFDSLCRFLQAQIQTTKFQVHRCYI